MTTLSDTTRVLALSGLGLLLAAISGCGQAGGAAAYRPTETEARTALEGALGAWKEGKTPQSLEALTPPVNPVDFQWQAGQALEGFAILKEEDGDESVKKFLVRLDLKKPAGPKEARYIVHGRGPVWVYREEDYARLLNMENNPKTPVSPGARSRR